MKKSSLTAISLSLLAVILIIFSILDWPNMWRSIPEVTLAILALLVAFGNYTDSKDQKKGSNITDERDQYIEYKSDHRTTKWLQSIMFVLFVLFIALYYFQEKNLILGLVAIVSLLYWVLSNVLSIIFGIMENSKN